MKKQKEKVSKTEMTDVVGELVNIISGNVKKNLEDYFQITISNPTVVSGIAHMVVIPDDRIRLLCIPFTVFNNEIICLSINIQEK